MAEESHKGVLDRQEARDIAAKALHAQLAMLEQMVNYGTNLIVRVISTTRNKHLGDMIACSVLLRQVVAMLDATHIALDAGHTQAAALSARTGLEASVYLEWMLATETERRGQYFYIGDLRKKRVWSERSIRGTPHNVKLVKNAKYAALFDEMYGELAGPAQAQIAEFDRVCSREPYKSINEDFAKRTKPGGQEKDWHVPLGVTSIREMTEKLGREFEYDMFYHFVSKVIHTSDINRHVRVKNKEKITIKPIRSLEGVTEILNYQVSSVVRAYRQILEKYRSGELPSFARIYAEEWRVAFHTIPKITVNYDDETK